MNTQARLVVVLVAGSIAIGVALVTAHPDHEQPPRVAFETPGVEQELLVNAPLMQCPGKRILAFTGEFEPGAKTPLHRHPGTELLYVLEGAGSMVLPERDGSEELTPGRMVMVEPMKGESSFIHQAVNLSTTKGMRTLVIVIHDEGTPPALPVDVGHE